MHVRDATVGPLSGTAAVSGCATSTSSQSMPSASHAICAKIVFVPWPISVLAASTRMWPSAAASTLTTEARCCSPEPVKPAPCMKQAKPMPRRSEPCVLAGKPRGLLLVAGQLERAIEEPRHVHRLAQDLPDGVRLAGGDEVTPAELVGGQTRGRRDAVHLQFEREDRLRRSEAAKRAVRRGRGRDRLRADADVGTVVRTGGVNRPARQDDGRQRAIRAAVDDELDVHGQQPAVGVDRRAVPRSRRMPLGRGDHVLEPVVHHLHRPAGLPREQRGVTGEDRRIFLLAAEPAARFHLDHANAFGRKAEQPGERAVNVVGALHRAPHRHTRLRIRDGEHAVRLDVELLLGAGVVFALDHVAPPCETPSPRRRAARDRS